MRNTILGIIALVFFGACNSEPKEEVGRYVPIPPRDRHITISILDTKTGIVYSIYDDGRGENDATTYYLTKENLINPEVKTAKISFKEYSSFKNKIYE